MCIQGFAGERYERKRQLGRHRYTSKWGDNIKMNLQELGSGGMYWIDLAQDRGQVVGAREGGNEFSCSIKCGEFLTR
jgi:hypothetical protein